MTFGFKIVLEKDKWPDEPEGAAVWRAYVPVLEDKGALSGLSCFCVGATPYTLLQEIVV